MITKEQAEQRIGECCKKLTLLRCTDSLSDRDRKAALEQVESEIKELKEITGPRHIDFTIQS